MATNPIQAVLFDMGGTLEDLYSDDAVRLEATRELSELLRKRGVDPGLSLPELQSTVSSGLEAYQTWRQPREIELPPERVWGEYIFPNHSLCPERLAEVSEEIMFFCETHCQVRRLRPEAPSVLEALQEKGFRLAIISNIISRSLVPVKLVDYGIARYFDPVITSADLGWRKPNERPFEEAARRMQLPPGACAYVGDTVSRDVIGARRAGYGLVLQIRSLLTGKADAGVDGVKPDAVIQDLGQILDHLPLRVEVAHDP